MKTQSDETETEEVETLGPPAAPPVTIHADDAEDDDEDGEGRPPVDKDIGRDKSGRWTKNKGKRQNAIKDNEEFRAKQSDFEKKLDEIRADQREQNAALIAALRQPQQGTRQEPQTPPEVAALDQQIEQKYALMEASLAKIAAGAGADETKNYYKLQREQTALIARAEGMKAGWGRQQEQRGQDVNPEHVARAVQLKNEFPEIAADDHPAWAIAGHFRRAMLTAKSPDTMDTDREAVRLAMRQLGIAPRAAAPGQRTRQAFAGPNGTSRGTQPRGTRPRTMEIDPRLVTGSGLSEKQLAQALFDDENE